MSIVVALIASGRFEALPLTHQFRVAWRVRQGRQCLVKGAMAPERDQLERAARLFRAALAEMSPTRERKVWARTCLYLATTHDRLAERDGVLTHLEASIALTRQALAHPDLVSDPRLTAFLRNSLGTALVRTAERLGTSAQLREAVIVYEAGLQGLGDHGHRSLRAGLRAGLGTALVRLGEREGDLQIFRRAVEVLQAALAGTAPAPRSMGWASTLNTLATAQIRLAERTGDAAMLQRAAAGLRAALGVRARRKAPIAWAATMTDLGYVLLRLGDLELGSRLYEEALGCFSMALRELPISRSPREQAIPRTEAPLDWANLQKTRAEIFILLAEARADPTLLQQALEAAKAALTVFSPEVAPDQFASVQTLHAKAMELLDQRRFPSMSWGTICPAPINPAAVSERSSRRTSLHTPQAPISNGVRIDKAPHRCSGPAGQSPGRSRRARLYAPEPSAARPGARNPDA